MRLKLRRSLIEQIIEVMTGNRIAMGVEWHCNGYAIGIDTLSNAYLYTDTGKGKGKGNKKRKRKRNRKQKLKR